MNRSKNKKPNTHGPSTEVHCAHDLEAALRELTSACAHGAIDQLEGLLASIAREFHPSSVTMTSTNIPDAIQKLSSVVQETSQAAQRVFTLVEQQKVLIEQNEAYTRNLDVLLRQTPVDPHAALHELNKSKEAVAKLRMIAHQIVEAQEFQDLCGQKVDKVIKLLSGLEDRLRLLFSQLRYPLPTAAAVGDHGEGGDINQEGADDILKRFGL